MESGRGADTTCFTSSSGPTKGRCRDTCGHQVGCRASGGQAYHVPAFRGALLKAVAKWEFSSSRGAQRGAYPASRKERGLDHPTTLRCCLSWALHMPCPGGHRQDTGGTVCRQRGQWINSAQRYEMTPTRNVHGQERHQNLGSRVCRKTWAWKSAGWESKVTLTGPSLPSPALNGPHLPIPTLPHLTCSQRPSPAHTCAHWPESAPTCPYLYT